MFEGPIGKQMMIEQGYVPPACTMNNRIAGPLIWSEINQGRSPCSGCNADRSVCGGQPKKAEAAEIERLQKDQEWLKLGHEAADGFLDETSQSHIADKIMHNRPSGERRADTVKDNTKQEATPQFFIDDDSGPWQLIGSAKNLSLSVENIKAYVQVALEQLLEEKSGDQIALMIGRQDMTEDEVDALPEL